MGPQVSPVTNKPTQVKRSKAGFMTGYPNKTFKPNKAINRAEGVVTIARFAKVDLTQPVLESPFPDLPGRHWAIKEINSAKSAGMLKYLAGKPFEPAKNLTRGEVAEILSHAGPVAGKAADLTDWEKSY